MATIMRMPSATGRGMELIQYEEVLFPNIQNIDPRRRVKFAEDFQYKQGDIVQCSYPKAGFHLMSNMIWKLKAVHPTDRPIDDLVECANPGTYDNQMEPRIICSHLKPNRLYPAHIENKGKVILILRNPKDVCVSWYHYLKNSTLYSNGQMWDEFFESFISGHLPSGSYFSYLRDWEHVLKEISDGKSNLCVELFYFEDLLDNPQENIARLNAYLRFNRDEAYLERVLKETTFDALREEYQSPERKHPNCIDADGNSIVFRKGKVGDWKNYFTMAQSEVVDDLLNKTLQYGLIKFKYEH